MGAAESFRLRMAFGAEGGAGELAGEAAELVVVVVVEKPFSEAGWEGEDSEPECSWKF